MRLVRFEYHDAIAIGLLERDGQSIVGLSVSGDSFDPVIDLIEADLAGENPIPSGETFKLTDVRLLPPISRPSKNILCVGKNYVAHAAEFSRSGFDASAKSERDVVPEAPIVFSKAPGTMVGAHADICPPWTITTKVDYEGELGVIIGRGGRAIARKDAYAAVWGYTVINDVTARDLQSQHKQWLLGKSIDTFCPIGPCMVSADELEAENLTLETWVNDELRQSANTRDLIFDIPTIIETLSASMNLCPGDIIATGTPAGVGIGFDPPKFLQTNDRVRVSISGIGEIENKVV